MYKYQVPFEHPFSTNFVPFIAGYAEPYVIGLLPRYVEIRTISPRALIQSIELPKPRYITQGKHMYVASTSYVWRLIPVSLPMQIQQLLQDKQFNLALMLAVSLHPRGVLWISSDIDDQMGQISKPTKN